MIKNERAKAGKNGYCICLNILLNIKGKNAEYMFWQKTSYPIELNYSQIIDQKIDYIHNNPVVAGYVTEPEAWFYSSACLCSPLQVEPL